ncbi:MAG: cation:proton antiporter, partial [Phycisphaerales bacterium]|nr:cation:proton antiporter [Phycisphaerales bacterium]
MHVWDTLFDVLLLLLGAFVFGVMFERLGQSAIMGYLLAGLLLGPNALNIIDNAAQVEAIAELGVALLLFTIGLEFSWTRLRKLGSTVFIGGAIQVVVTLAVTAGIAMAFGVRAGAAVAIGGMIALSSTACVLRLLIDRSEMDSVHGRLALGVLLLQDLAVVPLVLLVSVLGKDELSAWGITVELFTAGGLAILLVAVFYLVFRYVVPRLLNATVMRRNRELPILLAIVVGLGAAGIAHSVQLSPGLGAFIAGMILAESPFATQIRADVTALRTLLMTLFFSAVGMLADPLWMLTHLHLLIPLVAAMVIGKAAIIWLILTRFGRPSPVALTTGIVLAQVGEFSFVLASEAYATNLVGEQTFLLVISSTIIT